MKNLKQVIRNIPILGNLSVRVYRYLNPRKAMSIYYWVEKYLPNKFATIVQVGSNDGKTGDPIHDLIIIKKKWKAIFVEPVPYLFKRLTINYSSNPRFIFENIAINNGEKQISTQLSKKLKKISRITGLV